MTHDSPAGVRFLSKAQLSGLLFRVPCERRRIEAMLAKVGRVRLVPERGYPADSHPLHCELWSIGNGALRFGDVDQHRLAQRLGAMWGASMETLWSAALGPWSVRRGTPGLTSSIAEWNFMAASRATAATVGTYREMMVSVPGVALEGDDSGRLHTLVLGMATDSLLARWADGVLGFGYGKVPGRFQLDSRGWTVSLDGGSWLSVTRESPTQPRAAEVDVSKIEALFQLPLLGSPRPGGLARSWLRRSLRQQGVQVAPLALSVRSSGALLDGILPEELVVPPYSVGEPAGAIEFSNLEAWVSYPVPA